jgi:hypothetical protein
MASTRVGDLGEPLPPAVQRTLKLTNDLRMARGFAARSC